MTRRRIDSHSTEFGLWIRDAHRLDSTHGFRAYNVDYAWAHFSSGKYLFIEEKRFGGSPRPHQCWLYKKIDKVGRRDPLYHGFHILTFQNPSPVDGWMRLNGELFTAQDLIRFLAFEASSEHYLNFCDPRRWEDLERYL